MRTRKLGIFTAIFIVVVLLAAYGLALLRTYVFKPPPSGAGNPTTATTFRTSSSTEVCHPERTGMGSIDWCNLGTDS